jgi:solute carrier family 25 (mitochondrial carnitine/acylcarnitine transporter), member 20/29
VCEGISIPLISVTFVRTTSFTVYETSKRFFGSALHHPLYAKPDMSSHNAQTPSRYVITPPYQGFFALNAGVAFLAGITSGTIITIMSCPFEFTKIATQIELLMRRRQLAKLAGYVEVNVPMEARTPLQMARDIYAGRGFLGLYSGFNYHLGTLFLFTLVLVDRVSNRRSRRSWNGNLFLCV